MLPWGSKGIMMMMVDDDGGGCGGEGTWLKRDNVGTLPGYQ